MPSTVAINTGATRVEWSLNHGETLGPAIATVRDQNNALVNLTGWTSVFKGEYADGDPEDTLAINASVGSGIVNGGAAGTFTLTVQTASLQPDRNINIVWRTTDGSSVVRDVIVGTLTLRKVAT